MSDTVFTGAPGTPIDIAATALSGSSASAASPGRIRGVYAGATATSSAAMASHGSATFIGAGTGSPSSGTSDDAALPRMVAGEYGPWALYPVLDAIRRALLGAAVFEGDVYTQGCVVLTLGQLSEVYNVVNGLDAGAYLTASSLSRNSLAEIDRGLYYIYPMVPQALLELRALRLPSQFTDVIYRAVASDAPKYRVSGLATMVTMAAILQLHQ